MSNFIKLNKSFLDLNKYTNFTYIEVLLSLNIRVPHLCYHNQLPVSGNCRLCLGIIGADRKPAPLCATSVRPNDIVDYNSARVRRLRQDVLEFLLINHPMDCPSCDQGGECDLQDYSYNFGTDRSRHTFSYKKAILNKDRGSLVKTVMNRCINCTRCTRFFAEVVGSTLVGIIGRGINSEISSYVETKFADCEFSGNVIDLCPVGALTSHSNAFAYRPWNLKRLNSFDALDSLGSFITVHFFGSNIVKITPRINYNLNLNWISDKVRYMYDGLYKQRILKPLYVNAAGEYCNITWNEVFYTLKADLLSKKSTLNIGCYFGELLNNEIIFTASKFMDIIGNPNKYSIQDKLFINNDFNSNYLFNGKVTSLSNTDMCFIFGSNLKSELPLLNVRLRKQYLATALSIITFGIRTNLMYPTYFFGFKLKTIIKFIEGNNTFCKYLSVKKNPSFLLNLNLFKTESLANLFTIMKERLMSISKNITKNNFNYIYPDIDLYNKLYLNIQTKYKDTDLNMLDCLYLLNVDKNFDYFAKNTNLANIYTIYQGHHYNKYIDYARMILPVKPYIQELGSFVNVQGDILHIDETIKDDNLAVKNNILVLYSVFTTLFNTLKQNFKQVIDNNDYDHYNPSRKSIKDSLVLYNNIKLQNNYLKNYTINSSLYKFYANDNISLASQLMSNCNKTLVKRSNY
jgi:NADH-quinone oxidoreductase chain G|nr:NADH dehydrogenase subunit 11 [Blastocystis sp. subtype 3]